METPNTQAGYLTERIMEVFGLRSMAKVTLPTLDTQQYNAIYSHVLGTLEEAFSLLPPKRKGRI